MKGEVMQIPLEIARSPLNLWAHLSVKIVLNTISSMTMTRLGRVVGNWMVYVECTNKKLTDRSIRLISALTGCDYEESSHALFETLELLSGLPSHQRSVTSPSMVTIERLGIFNTNKK